MLEHRAELVVAAHDQLGECPVWDERERVLHRVDALAGAIVTFDPRTGTQRRLDVGRHIGSIVPRADDEGLLMAAEGGFFAVDSGGTSRLLAPVDAGRPDMLMNDGTCDPAGRFFAGSMSRDATPGRGALYRFDPPGSAVAVIEDVGVSNGLGWSTDGRSLFFIDSLRHRVDRLAYDVDAGGLGAAEVAFDLSSHPGLPDGMTIDAEGALWIAFWKAGHVRRFSPDGRVLAEVSVPVRRTTSCCLGGDDLRTLFITTARRGIRGPADDAEALAGGVFACEVEVPGRPVARWRPDGMARRQGSPAPRGHAQGCQKPGGTIVS